MFVAFLLFLFTHWALAANLESRHCDPRKHEALIMSRTNQPLVEITFVDKQAQRPPLATLWFNVTLRNDHSKPRWFLLPSKLNLPTSPLKNGVDGVDVFVIEGQGRVVIANFQGTGGFQALRLPRQAAVSLQNVAIAFWGKVPEDCISIEIIAAEQLRVNGRPAKEWFDNDPTSDVLATVNVAHAKRTSSRHIDNRREVDVVATGEERRTVQVPMQKHA
jgi:hypothetical protein